jgi:hypothetical protein
LLIRAGAFPNYANGDDDGQFAQAEIAQAPVLLPGIFAGGTIPSIASYDVQNLPQLAFDATESGGTKC